MIIIPLMKSFYQSLEEGYKESPEGSRFFSWHDGGNRYELWFERLLFDEQYYVALYKNGDAMTEKVVVKPGKIESSVHQAPPNQKQV